MLGLSTNINRVESPFGPDSFDSGTEIKLIGWWDFTDANSLFTGDVTGSPMSSLDNLATPSNNDPIVKVNNKSYDFSNRAMGVFVYAPSDNARPTFKTDGVNGLSYVHLDPSSNMQVFMASSDAVLNGSQSNDLLSGAELDVQDFSIVVVASSDIENISDTNQTLLNIVGGEENAEETKREITLQKSYSSDRPRFSVDYEGESGEALTAEASLGAELGTTLQIITAVTGTGTNNTKLYMNLTQTGDGTFANDAIIEFIPTGHPQNEQAGIGIGMSIQHDNSAPGIEFGPGGGFDGKIYEVLLYREALRIQERKDLTRYLMSKYSIT